MLSSGLVGGVGVGVDVDVDVGAFTVSVGDASVVGVAEGVLVVLLSGVGEGVSVPPAEPVGDGVSVVSPAEGVVDGDVDGVVDEAAFTSQVAVSVIVPRNGSLNV